MSRKRLPYRFAKQHHVIVYDEKDGTPTLMYQDDTELAVIQEVQREYAVALQLKRVGHEEFKAKLNQAYQEDASQVEAFAADVMNEDLQLVAKTLPAQEDLLEMQDDAPIIRLLNALFAQAIREMASDIHIECFSQTVSIRLRVDGLLREVLSLPLKLAPLIISRVKVMAKLDIAEKRLPQDGRITLNLGGHKVDVRVSTLPSQHGERVVLRILDQQAARLELRALGIPDESLAVIEKMIRQPHGIILVTGPTGSGKTTSLYAMLSTLNAPERNILTVEDPIEYDLPGIGQTQINSKVDMTFAKGLRAILRQDPDIVMVGEIRDRETADIAIQASLTGHLVFSTLHTNSAAGAITRLMDMGVEPFLLASSLIGVIGQRLVRRLCQQCKKPYKPNDEERKLLGLNEDDVVYEARGCEACHGRGFAGRTGIYEVLTVDDTIKKMINQGEGETRMREHAHAQGPSMREAGFKRVKAFETTLAEVRRVTYHLAENNSDE